MKITWSEHPDWFKGGIIGTLLLAILSVIFIAGMYSNNIIPYVKLNAIAIFFIELLNLEGYFNSFIFYSILINLYLGLSIGCLGGLLVNKIKYKTKNEPEFH